MKHCNAGVGGWRMALSATALAGLLLAAPAGRAEGTGQIDPEVLSAAVKKELKRLIEEEGVLDREIEKGIVEFIRKQQALARAREQQNEQSKAKNVRPVDPSVDHLYGNPDAAVTLVEYSDFECPFCKRFHATAKQLVDQSDGRINWAYRHFPLSFHNPGAQKEAEASECVAEQGGNDAFWRYSTLIYERTTSNGNGFPVDRLAPLAVEIGLDGEAFANCLESGRMAERVARDYQNGVAAGVTGTPGNILLHRASGDVSVMAGAVPLARLQRAAGQLLKRNGS